MAGKTKSTDISHATVTPLVQSSFEAIFVDQMQATVSTLVSIRLTLTIVLLQENSQKGTVANCLVFYDS